MIGPNTSSVKCVASPSVPLPDKCHIIGDWTVIDSSWWGTPKSYTRSIRACPDLNQNLLDCNKLMLSCQSLTH